MIELMPVIMFIVICLVLMAGFPVALSLGGTAIIFAVIGIQIGVFEEIILRALPSRCCHRWHISLVAYPEAWHTQ